LATMATKWLVVRGGESGHSACLYPRWVDGWSAILGVRRAGMCPDLALIRLRRGVPTGSDSSPMHPGRDLVMCGTTPALGDGKAALAVDERDVRLRGAHCD
jgi:hypothetical protein